MPKSDSEHDKALRLAGGPLKLPRIITGSQRTIRLFMAYLDRRATIEAIIEIANQKPYGTRQSGRKAADGIRTLREVGIPKNHEELCGLVTRAVALKDIAKWAALLDDETVLPQEALIPDDVLDACVKTYHAWVKSLSRQRR